MNMRLYVKMYKLYLLYFYTVFLFMSVSVFEKKEKLQCLY